MNKKFRLLLLLFGVSAGVASAQTIEDPYLSTDSISAGTIPVNTLSADTIPAETIPVEPLSADTISADTIPVEQTQQITAQDYESLSSELTQLKSQLNDMEEEQRFANIWKRKKYWKFGMGNPSIERTDGDAMTWETDYSVFIQQGRTAYFHSKPLWGMVKFGLDYGFLDINYSKLKLKSYTSATTSSVVGGGSSTGGFDEIESEEPDGSALSALGVDLGMHKLEYSLHIGPSISINPWNHIIVAAYFHVMPVASGILEDDNFSYGFGVSMAAGASVSYKVISVGIEGLWNKIKYKQVSFDDESIDEGNIFTSEEFKLKQKGPRFYIAFRF